jgi:hypothetical protein
MLNEWKLKAKPKAIIWPNFDLGTFGRLCEFACARDYTP